jgi:hypothetical protein
MRKYGAFSGTERRLKSELFLNGDKKAVRKDSLFFVVGGGQMRKYGAFSGAERCVEGECPWGGVGVTRCGQMRKYGAGAALEKRVVPERGWV